jgi:hypothetical protein
MTTVQKSFNLLFSLPDELITDIFMSFDPTHRIFHTPEFRKELVGPGRLNAHKNSIKQRIENHYLDIVDDPDSLFGNEYGYSGDHETESHRKFLKLKLIEYTEDNFEIYLESATNDYMYYKVLPKGSTKDNCAFLRSGNPRWFDGFVCYENDEDHYFPHTKNMPLIPKDPAPVCEWRDGLSLWH